MPGVREEVYGEKEHDPVPTEKSFWVDRENLVVVIALGVDASALEEELSQPVKRKGKQQPRKHRK